MLSARELLDAHADVFFQIVAATHRRVKVVVLVNDEQQVRRVRRILSEGGLPAGAVLCRRVPHNTMWVRDYGPVFVEAARGGHLVLDGVYASPDRGADDRVPAALARTLKLGRVNLPLDFEGGNLLSNGAGLLITTTTLVDKNAARQLDQPRLERLLRRYFGGQQVLWLEPLCGEPTGHVDMFAAFVAVDTVLVRKYNAQVDPLNAAVLDRNARRLAQARLPGGGRLRVVRIPMPDNQDGLWRTYTNLVFANGVLLVPAYPDVDPRIAGRAADILLRLLPGWRIYEIDSLALIDKQGALHCISLNVPAVRPAAPRRAVAVEPPAQPARAATTR